MAEAILRDRISSEEVPLTGGTMRSSEPEPLRRVETAAEELLRELQARWEDLKQRSEGEVKAAARSLAAELSEDAEYARIRARYYHENRPLQALGLAAAGAFVFGVALGLWRR